jgi:hypothetical protein
MATMPQFDLDPTGDVIAVWSETDDVGHVLVDGTFHDDSLGWRSPSSVSQLNVYATEPYILADQDGNAFAVWIATDSFTFNSILVGSVRPLGGSWSNPARISPLVTSVLNNFVMRLGPGGIAYLIWSAYDSSFNNLNIYYAQGNSIDGWSDAVQVSQ